MINVDPMWVYRASHIINLFPTLVKNEILSDNKFLEELGIATDATVSFGRDNISFSRIDLFNAIRDAFGNIEKDVHLTDINNKTWSLQVYPSERPAFSLTDKKIKIVNDSFWPLHGDINKRLSIFEEEAKNSNISTEEQKYWRDVLSDINVSDDAVSDLLLELDCSPNHIETLLRKEFSGSSNSISTLVPDNIRYYERLVGKYCGSRDVEEYCKKELIEYFGNRKGSGVSENDLLLCMHSSISKVIANEIFDEELYQVISEKAIETCHPIFLLSCLEIGILKFADSSSSNVKMLFECLTTAKVSDSIQLFYSMAIFVEGELARLQIFKGMPPYYRRLASFTQASLIVKVILEEKIAFDKVGQWAIELRGLYFSCQSLVDLFEEPRWLPSYLTVEQITNEFYGRINNVCQVVDKSEVVEYVQKELFSGSRLSLYSFLPGPLEGNSIPVDVPPEISTLLTKHIGNGSSLASFRVLINSAPFWKIDDKYLERIVSLLESAQHKLEEVSDKDSVYQVLNGLAQVSCTTRSIKLATSVTTLSRLYRNYIDVDSEPENYLALGVVAGAAFEDKDGWAEFIGQWCTELAYLPISEDAILRIKVMLETLCILEPYLYHTCSKPLDILRMLSGNKYTHVKKSG